MKEKEAGRYEYILSPLWRDGYHAAARLIEKLTSSIEPEVEMALMKMFVEEEAIDQEVIREQLRALWTSYCLHHDLNPDTFQYDCNLVELWDAVESAEPETEDWRDLDSFESFMCGHLV